jgi:hypothetical protein
MAKGKRRANPVGVVSRLVAMLTPLAVADRGKAIRAALTLLGDDAQDALDLGGGGGNVGGAGGGGGMRGPVPKEQAYFAAKSPRTKIEELAVAARYREERESAQSSTKSELAAIFKEARKNFDPRNYRRDLENARTAGLFTRGTGRDSATLADYGQRYVDALPDRQAVAALPKPKRGKKSKKRRKP